MNAENKRVTAFLLGCHCNRCCRTNFGWFQASYALARN